MRYLNKIVFINSAAVNFAEIELDGNVHFIGTQGVGKSTLLRAILFFYNANKTKLGIPREKMSFDEYYFPFQNSYIIYEVCQGERIFCVLAYKVNGKVAFRFFDSAFKKELFIGTDNRALASWDEIRAVLGREIHYTNLVTGYDDFRKIIYGDNQTLSPNFRQYALIESKQFQNIPRTIQNVFLNSNLEAKFIKDTIINSLAEDEFKIDLENYAHNHLRDFETQINDIQIWFKKQRNGQVLIKNQAQRVIDKYRATNYLAREKREFIQQLALRMAWISEHKPELSAAHLRESESLRKLEHSRANLQDNYRNREQKLISELDYLKKELQKAKEKQGAYEAQNIAAVLQQVAQKDALVASGKSLQAEKELLTAQYAEVTQKYAALMLQIDNQEQEFSNQRRAEINALNAQLGEQSAKVMANYQSLLAHIQRDSEGEINQASQAVLLALESINNVKNQQAELKYRIFFQAEIQKCQTEVQQLEKTVSSAKSIVLDCKNTVHHIRKTGESEAQQLQFKSDTQIAQIHQQQQNLLAQIQEVERKIAQSSTAFYGWLNDNYPQWEHTIAKVIDEGEVLFNTELNPRWSEGESRNFFGLEIDLSALPNRIKSLPEYEREIAVLQAKLQQHKQEERDNLDTLDAELARLKNKLHKQIQSLQDAIAENEYKIERGLAKIKQLHVEAQDWEQRSVQEKHTARAKLEAELEKLTAERLQVETQLENLRINLKRQLTNKEKQRDGEISELTADFAARIAQIEATISANSEASSERRTELKLQQNSELASRGAHTERLQYIDSQLTKIDGLLTLIHSQERLVIEYEKDKRELFDLVPELKAQRASLELKHNQWRTEHQIAWDSLHAKFTQQQELVAQLNQSLTVFATDEAEWEKFNKSELYAGAEPLVATAPGAEFAAVTAVSIISEIKERHYQGLELFKELQQAVNLFTGNFAEANIFKFATKFVTDDDFREFARSLKEFIEEDKIQEFEKRVNERFASIVQQIAKETTELNSKEAEIEKVIKKINDDFVAKNFVQAIKEMEMRTQNSSNSIVKILLKIKEFYDEHGLGLGETNLFTTTDGDVSNRKAVELLKQLLKELDRSKSTTLTLSESFELQFRIVENDNDSGWVEKLSNVGSEGTDVLVKAMINILLLNVFKNSASRKFKDFKLHCMMDEIGRLHPNNVQGILRFANERNILLINGSPTSQNALDYKYTYKLAKEASPTDAHKYVTRVSRLVKVAGERNL